MSLGTDEFDSDGPSKTMKGVPTAKESPMPPGSDLPPEGSPT
jgi:hypothetical protein